MQIRGTILKASKENERKGKLWSADNGNVNGVVLQFFLICGMNIQVNGPVFQNKSKGNSLASNEWLEGVQAWHHINFSFLSGESAEVNMGAAEDWKSKVHHIMDEHPPTNQFNADEMGLF